jgi:hypothetical protein
MEQKQKLKLSLMTDKLVTCTRCGSNACYENRVNAIIKTYQCFGCGFVSNTLMKKGSEFLVKQMETLPDLYKELMGEDKKGLIWMPSYINKPEMGMVFMNGTRASDAKWAAVKAVKVTDENMADHQLKDGTYPKYFMDMKNMQSFEEKDYMEALDFVGFFQKDVEIKK